MVEIRISVYSISHEMIEWVFSRAYSRSSIYSSSDTHELLLCVVHGEAER
jgi:hypothetical protein